MNKMITYMVSHYFGDVRPSVYFVQSRTIPTEIQVCHFFDIDFEEGEFLDIETVGEIKTLPDQCFSDAAILDKIDELNLEHLEESK